MQPTLFSRTATHATCIQPPQPPNPTPQVKPIIVRDLERVREELRPLFLADLLGSVGIKPKALPEESMQAAKQLAATAGPAGPSPAPPAAAPAHAHAGGAASGAGPARRRPSSQQQQQQAAAARDAHAVPQSDTDLLMSQTPDQRPPARGGSRARR